MNLEQELGNEMLKLYGIAKEKCNYNATRFIQMFYKLGAIETAKTLINSKIRPMALRLCGNVIVST